jgi:RNA recognition motif-containing protein
LNTQYEYLKQIYVCDLDLSITDDHLRDIFAKYYPSVSSAKIIVDPSTKLSKGYGFVKFSNQVESQKALYEMNGKFVFGKPIKTKYYDLI